MKHINNKIYIKSGMRGSWGQDYFSDEFRGRSPPVSINAQHLLLYVFNVMKNAHHIRGNTVSVT